MEMLLQKIMLTPGKGLPFSPDPYLTYRILNCLCIPLKQLITKTKLMKGHEVDSDILLQVYSFVFYFSRIESLRMHTALYAHRVTRPSMFRMFLPRYIRFNSEGGDFTSFILL